MSLLAMQLQMKLDKARALRRKKAVEAENAHIKATRLDREVRELDEDIARMKAELSVAQAIAAERDGVSVAVDRKPT